MDIKLKDFEGPLDLLLHLVSKYQVDIYDVPITEVIEQYLAYVATLQAMKLEVTGEYMVMASQLMLIKSRKLLPKVADNAELEDDLEQDLLSQIEEYRRFKLLGEKMSLQHEDRALYYSKPKLELVYEDAELLHDKSTIDLFLAFSKVIAKKQEEFSKSHTTIVRDEYKIEDMMDVVRQRCAGKNRLALQEIFAETKDMNEVITLFLATLELVKVQEVQVIQEENFGNIYLVGRGNELAEIEALLFVAGEDGLKVHQLAEILSLPPTGVIQSLEKLAEQYEANPDSSLTLLETSKTYKLVTKPEFAEILRAYSRAPINQSLSRAALETLSIIAYKQPITRIEIDDIRGVNSSGALAKLLAFELVREDGKKEVIGRPNLYVTTDYFLDYMGINHLDELPIVEETELVAEESQLFIERTDIDENQ